MYRVFNQYYVAKHHKDANTTKYLYELLKRVLEEIDYTSEEEKLAMYQIVSNWTSVNRVNSLKVYGNVNKVEPDDLEVSNFYYSKEVYRRFIRIRSMHFSLMYNRLFSDDFSNVKNYFYLVIFKFIFLTIKYMRTLY